MSLLTADEVYESVVQPMPPEEQERLAAKITASLAGKTGDVKPGKLRDIREFRGMVPYPFFGEDAQQYITRTRKEGDEDEERFRKGNP